MLCVSDDLLIFVEYHPSTHWILIFVIHEINCLRNCSIQFTRCYLIKAWLVPDNLHPILVPDAKGSQRVGIWHGRSCAGVATVSPYLFWWTTKLLEQVAGSLGDGRTSFTSVSDTCPELADWSVLYYSFAAFVQQGEESNLLSFLSAVGLTEHILILHFHTKDHELLLCQLSDPIGEWQGRGTRTSNVLKFQPTKV
jgi:hypothetical protein